MNSRDITVVLRLDTDANAASIIFDSADGGRSLRTYPVQDASGDLLATVTFAPDGRLVELELLDASQQLPRQHSE